MTDLSSEIGSRKNRQLGKAVYQNRALSKAGLSERLFALLFSGLVYPQIWEDPDIDMEAMALMRGPSHRHHRVGRLQRARLPDALAGANRRGRPQRRPYRAEPPEARRGHAPAGAGRPVPLLRRSRQPRRIPRPTTASSRRISTPGRVGIGKAATGAARRRIAAFDRNFYQHRPARPVHRRGPPRGAALWRRRLENHRRRRTLERPAPLLRRGTRPAVRRPPDPLATFAKVVAVRARHPAGAV